MKDNDTILDVLIYLLENYSGMELPISEVTIKDELSAAGFGADDIVRAFGWIDSLSAMDEASSDAISLSNENSIRVFSEDELAQLGFPVLNYLIELRTMGAIDSIDLEVLLERLMAVDIDAMNLDQIKRVILLFLVEQDDYDYYSIENGISLERLGSMIH